MSEILSDIFITYSNQKARDIKKYFNVKPFDKIVTLDECIIELFEKNSLKIQVDSYLAGAIIYQIIQGKNIEYFEYLNEDSSSLNTIYNFLIKCNINEISIDLFHKNEKLMALEKINKEYQKFKKDNNLVDICDMETEVLKNINDEMFKKYNEVYIDSFEIGNISFVKSNKQKEILKKLSKYKKILHKEINERKCTIIQSKQEVFDNQDEVRTAIKIARKLLEDGENAKDILILASDINEYAPFYKLYLDEYEIKGFTSIGTPINSFVNSSNASVRQAKKKFELKIKSLEFLYKKLGLKLNKSKKESMQENIKILDEKIGIELTEPNQIIGLSKKYKHIIFLGTDINHFPPQSSDNFLYSYQDDIKYFNSNNYFTSSQTQVDELERLSENLYLITATHSDKRELVPSALIDEMLKRKDKQIIDLSDIKSLNELALIEQTIKEDKNSEEFYKSIQKNEFTKYDGLDIKNLECEHLSASQINKYLSCPLAYLYSNKISLKAPNNNQEGFDAMEQGSLMHLCYELFGKKIKDNKILSIDKEELFDLMYEVSIEAYNDEHTNTKEENIHHKLFLKNLQAGLKDDENLGLLAKFVNYYIKNAITFNYFKTSEFEKEFCLDKNLRPRVMESKEDKNYFIRGFIDRLDNLDKEVKIIDYKSKKLDKIDKKKQEEVDSLKDVQLALYILYASQEYENKKSSACLLSFKGNEAGIEFSSLSSDKIYTKEYEDKLIKLINKTKNDIKGGKFTFNNTDETTCGYCDIKNICHENLLKKEQVI